MHGRLEQAVRALTSLVDRLEPADNFGVVAFDDRVELIVPAGPLTDKRAVHQALAALDARGSTNLSAGYLRGIQEARRVAGSGGATLLLISDGRANEGMVDADQLAGVAAEAHRHGVVSSTLGWGDGYDERLLSAIARGGSGNEGFAADSDAAVALIAGEVEGLLSQTVQAASLLIRLSENAKAVQVVNDLYVTTTKDGIVVELGSLYSGETRRFVLTLAVPGVAALGLAGVATLQLSYVELASFKQHIINIPLHVNVVPGDQAAGRVPDPVVRTELLYQKVQQAKRSASRHLSVGDHDAALAELDAAAELLKSADLPHALAQELAQEADELRYTAGRTRAGEYTTSAKYLSMSSTYKSRKRGRDLKRTGQAWHAEPEDPKEE
jgi:Ca-activated chloride channel family protein